MSRQIQVWKTAEVERLQNELEKRNWQWSNEIVELFANRGYQSVYKKAEMLILAHLGGAPQKNSKRKQKSSSQSASKEKAKAKLSERLEKESSSQALEVGGNKFDMARNRFVEQMEQYSECRNKGWSVGEAAAQSDLNGQEESSSDEEGWSEAFRQGVASEDQSTQLSQDLFSQDPTQDGDDVDSQTQGEGNEQGKRKRARGNESRGSYPPTTDPQGIQITDAVIKANIGHIKFYTFPYFTINIFYF
jgi:cobalamin biosynthesis protein CobT